MRAELLKCPLFRQLTTKVLRTDQQSFQGPEVYIWVMDRVSERASEWVNMLSILIIRSSHFAYSRVKKFTGKPVFSKIKSLVAQEKNYSQPNQNPGKEKRIVSILCLFIQQNKKKKVVISTYFKLSTATLYTQWLQNLPHVNSVKRLFFSILWLFSFSFVPPVN